MPPSAHDLRHYQNMFTAYRAKLRTIVSTHKKHLKTAIGEVDAGKTRDLQERIRNGKNETG